MGYEIELRLCGSSDTGNPRAISKETLDRWNQMPGVVCLGSVSDMLPELHTASIFCLPTSYREGIPRALIEAASCGLPHCNHRSSGCRDIVHDGVNGLLIPTGDRQALVNALKRLLDNPELSQRMGMNGRQRVIEEFSLERVISMHFMVYQSTLLHLSASKFP